MVKRNEKATEEGVTKKKRPNFSQISEPNIFQTHFPEYRLNENKVDFMLDAHWMREETKDIFVNWLLVHAPDWATSFKILPFQKTVRSHFPIMLEIINSLIPSSNTFIHDIRVGDGQPSDEVIYDAVRDFAAENLRQNSRASSEDVTFGSEISSFSPADAQESNSISLNDEDKVYDLYVEIEKRVKESTQSNFAEFTVADMNSKMTLIVFEFKQSLLGDNNRGLYQLASEMIVVSQNNNSQSGQAPRYVYGVYSDLYNIRFVLLDTQTNEFKLSPIICFIIPKPELGSQAVLAVAYFFFIFQIDPKLPSVGTIAAKKSNFGNDFSESIRKTKQLEEEKRKSGEEMRQLEEEKRKSSEEMRQLEEEKRKSSEEKRQLEEVNRKLKAALEARQK